MKIVCFDRFFDKDSYTLDNAFVRNELVNSYSQYGEDLVIDGILENKKTGFYVDIGANDPSLLNNTRRFYNKGWSGINIEPNPILYKKLIEQRPRDINLNVGIGMETGELPFYILSADTLSSFSFRDAKRNCKVFKERIVETINIPIHPIVQIFEKYVGGKKIDLLSIDVEGFELGILESNNWDRYRPHIILIELHHHTRDILAYLEKNNYNLVYKNSTNGIFMDVTVA